VPHQRFAQRGDEPAVQLDRDQPATSRGQRHRQGSDTGADLEHLVFQSYSRGFGDRVAQGRVGEEVLAETMPELDAMAPQQLVELMGVGRVDHFMLRNSA
jgi:hypothetical protein